MDSFSPGFVVSVFAAGVLFGASFVALLRRARIEMLKNEFQQELEAIYRRQATTQVHGKTEVLLASDGLPVEGEGEADESPADTGPGCAEIAPAVSKSETHNIKQ